MLNTRHVCLPINDNAYRQWMGLPECMLHVTKYTQKRGSVLDFGILRFCDISLGLPRLSKQSKAKNLHWMLPIVDGFVIMAH